MKKVISILAIMMVIACSVFAATGDTLTITASAAEIKPDFILQGKLTGTGETETTYKTATTTLASVLDPTADTITATVQVLQNSKSRYSKPVTIKVYATPFANTVTSTVFPTAAVTAGDVANVSGKLTSTCVVGTKDSYNALVVTATYKGGFLDATSSAIVVGGGTFTWAPDETLPVKEGEATTTYTATVVVEYTAS